MLASHLGQSARAGFFMCPEAGVMIHDKFADFTRLPPAEEHRISRRATIHWYEASSYTSPCCMRLQYMWTHHCRGLIARTQRVATHARVPRQLIVAVDDPAFASIGCCINAHSTHSSTHKRCILPLCFAMRAVVAGFLVPAIFTARCAAPHVT